MATERARGASTFGSGAALLLLSACTTANPAFGLDGSGSDDGTTTATAADPTRDSQATSADATADADGTATSTANPETGGDDRGDVTSDATSDATVADSGVDQTGPSSESDGETSTSGSDPNTTGNMSSEAGSSDAASDDANGVTTGGAMCALAGVSGCGDCMSEVCCEPLTACNGVDECACLADCLAEGGSAATCADICKVANAPDEWPALVECVIDNCPDGDECPNAGDG